MIRLLLSLLALLTGAAVPGMAQACEFSACGTEIGAQAETARQAAPDVAEPVRGDALVVVPALRERAPAWQLSPAPAIATVLIGIDRARQ